MSQASRDGQSHLSVSFREERPLCPADIIGENGWASVLAQVPIRAGSEAEDHADLRPVCHRVVSKVVRCAVLAVVVVDPERAVAGGKGHVLPGIVDHQTLNTRGEVRSDAEAADVAGQTDRKSTRLNSSH